MTKILLSTRLKVIERYYMSAFTEKSVTEVRSKESGPACYENMLTLAILHETLSFSDPQKVSRYKPTVPNIEAWHLFNAIFRIYS
jgi:hypothetical protein